MLRGQLGCPEPAGHPIPTRDDDGRRSPVTPGSERDLRTLDAVLPWLAFGMSLLALGVAVLSAIYSRRQAVAVEDANWGANDLKFHADVDRPHSGAGSAAPSVPGRTATRRSRGRPPGCSRQPNDRIWCRYCRRSEMDDWRSAGWPGVVEANRSASIHRSRRPSLAGRFGAVAGPLYAGRHRRDVVVEVELPPQPWVY